MNSEIETVDIKTELQVFDSVAAKIAEMKEENANLVFDYEDEQGNKEARSWIARLRKLKKPLNDVHKLAKSEAKKLCDALDGKKREYMGEIEEMIKLHHEPIWEIEQRELAIEAEKQLEEERLKEEAEAKRLAEIEAREKAAAEKEAAVLAKEAEIRQKEREAEIAEQARRQAAEDAKQALIDAENKRLADVQRAKDEAAAEAAEKEWLAKQQREAEEFEAARLRDVEEARRVDTEHRKAIHSDIWNALVHKVGILPTDADVVVRAMQEETIPHITIQY
jgi:colicin import membrane protein